MNAHEPSFRCPACDTLSNDETAAEVASVLLCEHCGHTIAKNDLLAGADGILGVRPDPASDGWQRSFQAVYPDGTRQIFDLDGHAVREGEPLPGTTFVVKRWEVSDKPVNDGTFEVVGFLSSRADN